MSISTEIPPGRKTRGTSPARVMTVDSTPTEQSPESIMSGTLPSRSFSQCFAEVGLGFPDIFAEGAASGTPAALIIALAIGCSGMRTPTVSSPPLVLNGMRLLFLRIIVSGPGQKAFASFIAFSGTLSTRASHWESSLM